MAQMFDNRLFLVTEHQIEIRELKEEINKLKNELKEIKDILRKTNSIVGFNFMKEESNGKKKG